MSPAMNEPSREEVEAAMGVWHANCNGRCRPLNEVMGDMIEAAAKVRAERERADVVLHINNTIGVERADMRFSRIKNGLPVFEGQAIEVNLKKGDSVVIRPIGGKEEANG